MFPFSIQPTQVRKEKRETLNIAVDIETWDGHVTALFQTLSDKCQCGFFQVLLDARCRKQVVKNNNVYGRRFPYK